MPWWWKSLFRRQALDAQLASEVRFHIEELTDANIAAGMSREEARRRAVLEFGGGEQIKEELRDVHRVAIVEITIANLRSAFRFLRKSPGFSLVVILTLALGIGANSAVFSAIDAILLRPLPFPNGDQLMHISQFGTKIKNPTGRVAPIRLEEWNRMNSTFQAMTGYYTENNSETSGVLPEKVQHAYVAPRFFQTWRIGPALGRDFSPEEEHFGGPDAVVISDRFWRGRFNASPDAIGKKVRVDGRSLPIVGVLPASFLFEERDVDLWSPISPDAPLVTAAAGRTFTWYRVVGRLKSDVSIEQARANLATVQAQLGKTYPRPDADLGVAIEPLKETTVGGVRRSLWMLFGSVSLLLLIACTNIVALLLARATQRQHEIAVRFSLGAPRGAIVWQLLTETFVLAMAGALLGLLVAGAASRVFRSLAGDLPRVEEIQLDARIVLYALLCSVIATILCGLFPALRGTRKSLSSSLAQTSRSQVSGRNPLQWLLVGTQVALAVTLLAGAGLLLRSLQALGRVSPGFEASHVLTFHISGSYGETADWAKLTERIKRTLEELRSIPGIEAATTAATLPGVTGEYQMDLRLAEGEQDPDHKIVADSRFVSPGYFVTTQIPLLTGELCREPKFTSLPADGNGAHRIEFISQEILVNRKFAETYLPRAAAAVGYHLRILNSFAIGPGEAEIRGIVGDAREEGLHREPEPTVYWCMSASGPDPFYLVRTHGEPMAMAETIRQKIHEIEPARSVFDITPLEQHIDETFAENRLRTVLLTFFAATAISLACVGLYGTLSYSVNVRQREVGLRMALGALRGQIVRQFLLQGLSVTVLGCLTGLALALASGRLLSGMLYDVSSSDSATLASVVAGVLLVAAIASLVPALRAARLDPMHVLREE